jgi:tetratricopeptide (TPR) repeat protein
LGNWQVQTTPKECDKNFEISGKVEEMRQNSGLAHCMYSGKHWDYCSDYRKMVINIREYDWESDSNIELHLRLFKLIPNKLVPGKEYKEWKAYKKAGEAFNKATDEVDAKLKEFCVIAKKPYDKNWLKACDEILEVYDKVWNTYEKALHSYNKAWQIYLSLYEEKLDALHYEMFPDCPWNGETIFGEANK